VLVDSLVALGALRKMRSGAKALLRQLLPIGMIALALGIRFLPRWIRSKYNPADGPSRGCRVGPAPETADKDSSDSELDDQKEQDSENDWLRPGRSAPGAHYVGASHL